MASPADAAAKLLTAAHQESSPNPHFLGQPPTAGIILHEVTLLGCSGDLLRGPTWVGSEASQKT